MLKPEYADALLDRMLTDSGTEALENLYDYWSAQCENDTDMPSPEFEKKMQKIIRKMRTREKKSRHRHISKKLVATIVAVIGVTGILGATQVDAWRVAISNILVRPAEGNNIDILNTDNNIPSDLPEGTLLPTYIPDSYTISSVDAGSVQTVIYFSDPAENQIVYRQYYSGESVFREIIDKEAINAKETKEIKINNKDAVLISDANSTVKIIWDNSVNFFFLSGDCSESELIKMAKSVK